MWQKAKNIYHLGQAISSHTAHGFPARGIIFIGVTGTDGKTTTSSIIYHILRKAGHRAALISTVAAIINDKSYDTGFHVTTPDAWQIAKYIQLAKKEGVKYVVVESTSHALDQNRIFGIRFAVGVVTNITHEHLDYHKSYEKYVEAKFKLLKNSQVAVINRDDASYKSLELKIKKQEARKIKSVTYGLGKNADINPHVFPFKNSLLGEFNQYNCLAAIAVCRELGIEPQVIREALLDFTAPVGRNEIVYDKEFRVIIDFAHTPNSIEQILKSIRADLQPKGRIIHVFGAAGLRDVSKRPFMGRASSELADILILTAEDPRKESVEQILEQITSGIKNQESRGKEGTLLSIPDRQEAIDIAIKMAQKGDIVVITGKGHERSMNYGKGEVSWSDHEAVKKALAQLSLRA